MLSYVYQGLINLLCTFSPTEMYLQMLQCGNIVLLTHFLM
jgi:hypothetical protein